MRTLLRATVFAVAAFTLIGCLPPPPVTSPPPPTPPPAPPAPPAPATCDRWMAANGDDGSNGSSAAPVRTMARMVSLLSAGQTGCLRAGDTFGSGLPYGDLVQLKTGGVPGKPITVRSAPGARRARFVGQLELQESAHDIVFTDIDFAGTRNVPKGSHLIINGDRITLRNNDITSPEGICVNAGTIEAYVPGSRGIVADDLLVERNRIHGCGSSATLTRADSGVHGVYLVNTARARIVDNEIFDNRNRGVQLWPLASDTTIEHNVLHANGANLNIGSYALNNLFSTGTTVRANIITASLLLSLTSSQVPPGDTEQILGNFPAGTGDLGNVVENNCIFHTNPAVNFGGYGYKIGHNTLADPLYMNAAAGDFRLAPGSPCAGLGPRR